MASRQMRGVWPENIEDEDGDQTEKNLRHLTGANF
jgi:hypothetical protein